MIKVSELEKKIKRILKNTGKSVGVGIAAFPLVFGGPGTIFAGETPSFEDHLNGDTASETYDPQSKKDKKNQKKTGQKQESKGQETTTDTTNPYKIDLLDIRIGSTKMEDIEEGQIIRNVPYGERIYVEPQDAKDDSGMRTSWGIKPVSNEEYNALLKELNPEERKRIKQSVDRDAKGDYQLDEFGYIAVRGRRVVSDDESQNLTVLGVAQGELVKIIADFEKDEVTPPEESTFFYVVYGKKQPKEEKEAEEKEKAQPKEPSKPSRKDTTAYKIPMKDRWTRPDTRADEPVVQNDEPDFKPSGTFDIGVGLLDMGYKPAKEEDPSFSTNDLKARILYLPNKWVTLVGNFNTNFDSDWIGGNSSRDFSLWRASGHAFIQPASKIPLGVMGSIAYHSMEHNDINSLYSSRFEDRSSSDISGSFGAGILTPQNKEIGLYAMAVIGARYHTLDRDQIDGNMVRASHRSLGEGRWSKGFVAGGHIGRLAWPVSLELEYGKNWSSSLGTIIDGEDNPYWDKPLIFESGTDEYLAAQLSAKIVDGLGLFVNGRVGKRNDLYVGENLQDLIDYVALTAGIRVTFNPNK